MKKKHDQEVRQIREADMFVDEIAQELGMTKTQVNAVISKAYRKIRFACQERGLDADYFFKDVK